MNWICLFGVVLGQNKTLHQSKSWATRIHHRPCRPLSVLCSGLLCFSVLLHSVTGIFLFTEQVYCSFYSPRSIPSVLLLRGYSFFLLRIDSKVKLKELNLFSGPTHQLFWFKMITMMWDETIYLKNCEVVEKVKISKSNMIQKLDSKMDVNITGWGGNDFLYLWLRFWRKCSVVWSLSGVEDHLDPFIILIHSHSHSCWDELCISWRRDPNGVLIQTAAAAMTNFLSESHGCISSASVFRPQMFLCSNISRMAPCFNHN